MFKLEVTCTKNPNASKDARPEEKYINSRGFELIHSTKKIVTSGHLRWMPKGDQAEKFKDNPIAPVHKDILITHLRPGQVDSVIRKILLAKQIDLEAACVKGLGMTHAKWSPV